MGSRLSLVVLIGLLLPGCNGEAPPANEGPGDEPASEYSDAAPAGADERGASTPPPPSLTGGQVLSLGDVALTAPDSWRRLEPGSSMISVEFALPRVEGDDADARLTVSSAGGSVEANIDRWKGQFDPLTEERPVETMEAAGKTITIVDLSGNFNDARGPMAPAIRRPGYRMIAAIVPGDGGQAHFIKATGPEATMAHHAEAIREFVRSTRPAR